ncbi:MAG: glycosyltransferase 87 family protein [Acidobacteriia bacterium]|nr:glycosyltransferase 87 family protein [Terriglobia bacterium]
MLRNPKLGLLLSLLMAGSMWFYVQHVLIAYQRTDAAAHDNPRGNLSDLYPRWLGARELLLHHRDPYSPELTREIQAGYYGRPLDSSRPSDPRDQQGFAYPVYVVFLLAPIITLPFSVVQVGFRWFLVVLTAATVPLWLRALRWCPSRITLSILTILTLGSFPAVQGIKLQQLSLVVSGLIAGCAALLAAGHLLLAGVVLAVATIKPQLALPLAAWLLLWSLSDWRRRQRFLWGFCGTMAALLGAAQYMLPGWIGRFHDALAAYRDYTGGARSVLDLLTTPTVGRILSVLVLLALAAVCWRVRSTSSDSDRFGVVMALVLAGTIVIIPTFAPYNQVLLLPAVFLLVRRGDALWRQHIVTRIAVTVTVLAVSWPWLAATSLAMASLMLPPQSVQRAWFVPFFTSNTIPVAVLALFAYSMRHLRQPD